MADEQKRDEDGLLQRAGRGAADLGRAAGRTAGELLGSKALSSALMEGAFEKFGQAFTDTGYRGRRGEGGPQAGSDPNAMAPWRAAGAKAAAALDERWQKMEYEDLQQTIIKDYTDDTKVLSDRYKMLNALLDDGKWQHPDGKIEELDVATEPDRARLLRYRGQLHTDFFTQLTDLTSTLAGEGVKYPNNDMIQEQLMNVFEAATNNLNVVANPQERIQAERAYSDIAVQERQSRAARDTAKTAAKTAARPISVKEALADPNIGIANILPWAEDTMMNSAQAGAYIAEGKAVLTAELHEMHKTEWVAGGGKEKEYDKLDPENIEWVESQLAQSGGAIQRAATVEFVRAKDPKTAERAKQYSPQYYEMMSDVESASEDGVGVKPGKRITEKQRKANVQGWKEPLAAKLEAYMADAANDPDIEVAINHIVEEWLPQAITGATQSTAPSEILTTQSESTAQYRREVAEFARMYLEQNFHKLSKVAAEQNKEATRKARRRAPRGRGAGGLGRAVSSLFGDE